MSEKAYSTDGVIFGDVDLSDVEGECGYYSGDMKNIKPSDILSKWCVDEILERMDERLWGECGEASEDSLSLPKEKNDELAAIIAKFMDENCEISCFKVVNVQFHPLDEQE